ncbi:hypothetical protein LshimejAT787_0202750 [Lyophyllum shimeji]|uniref:Uncharacterized protein n=1 Tax=Lyophyllum shimeji TaxID=47721 RepID=A0A9P3PEX2_LYOSH|nr:hypothetical protein LshimejAT787_0202750 [Lyophyllum shimeji]
MTTKFETAPDQRRFSAKVFAERAEYLHNEDPILPKMTVKMLGYIISDQALLQYGLENKLGTDENDLARENTIVEAATHIFAHGSMLDHGRLVGVSVNGELRTCLAVACNDPYERFPLPSREKLDKFKRFLKMDADPRWYKYE